MAKKPKETEQVDGSLDLNLMAKGLDGVSILSGSEVLNTRRKMRGRVEIINCLLGGGRPYGSITGAFGPPSSGKSTEAYEAAVEFLRLEPHGIVIILDQESSADPSRLEYLGMDTTRVLRVKSTSIDAGFTQLIKLLTIIEQKQTINNLRIPVFVVWDTISKGRAEEDEDASRMDARNRARVIKSRMSDLNPWLDRIDIILVLLNQVIISADKYGNITNSAGGGVALKHDEHLRLYITDSKTTLDPETGMALFTTSWIDLDKTKLSPKMTHIPLIFDNTRGGKIDEEMSFLSYFIERKLLVSAGGFWHIAPLLEATEGKFYQTWLAQFAGNKRMETWNTAIRTNPLFYLVLRLAFMDIVGDKYTLQKVVMRPYYITLLEQVASLTTEMGNLETLLETTR